MSTPRILAIDTDPGIDDALALALALGWPAAELALLTTVAGNTDIHQTTANAGLLLELFGAPASTRLARGAARPLRRRPVDAEGFHGPDGLGGTREVLRGRLAAARPARRQAARQLVAAARHHGRALTVVALGPLTNLAHALSLDAAALRGVGRIVVMGGAVRAPGNVTPAAEFNFYADPHAAAAVLGADLPLTLVPLDVTQAVRLRQPELRAALGRRRDLRAQALRRMLAFSLARHGDEGIAMHDPLAVAVALQPDLVRTQRLPIAVVCDGALTAGMCLEDRRPYALEPAVGGQVEVALEVEADAARRLFEERVLQHGAPRGRVVRGAKLAQLVVVGSANVDLTVRTQRLPRPGETVIGSDLQRSGGGKGANQAIAASRAGATVTFAACVGNDQTGRELREQLRADGIDLRAVSTVPRPTGAALIIVDEHGQNQIAVAAGANQSLTPAHLAPLGPHLRAGTVLVTQLESPMDVVVAALNMGRAAGCTTVLNPAPAAVLPIGLPALVDVLVPNELEAEALVGQPVRTLPEARRALSRLQSQGFANVVITLGRRGALWASQTRQGRVRGLDVEVVDTTAAGDTFVGYLAVALAEGLSLADAVALGNAAAAQAVTRPGAESAVPLRANVAVSAGSKRRGA